MNNSMTNKASVSRLHYIIWPIIHVGSPEVIYNRSIDRSGMEKVKSLWTMHNNLHCCMLPGERTFGRKWKEDSNTRKVP